MSVPRSHKSSGISTNYIADALAQNQTIRMHWFIYCLFALSVDLRSPSTIIENRAFLCFLFSGEKQKSLPGKRYKSNTIYEFDGKNCVSVHLMLNVYVRAWQSSPTLAGCTLHTHERSVSVVYDETSELVLNESVNKWKNSLWELNG